MPKHRLISLSPDNTEILCRLGLIDDLVGISQHCDYPESLQAEKPIVSDFGKLDLQAIVDLKPDLIFASTYYQADMLKTLVDHHIRVFVTQPSSLKSVYENILWVGAITERVEKAKMLIEEMQAVLHPEESLSEDPDFLGPKIWIEEWGNPIMAAAPWIQEMAELAGFRLALPLRNIHTRDRIVSPEMVSQAHPDVIVLSWCGCHGNIPLEKVLNRPTWGTMEAIQNNRVIAVEDTFFVRPGPRLVFGFKQLQKIRATYKGFPLGKGHSTRFP
jgi:iron complex transport system substrate-binding protein